MTFLLRDLSPLDIDRIVVLNNAATPAVPFVNRDDIVALLETSDHAIGVVDVLDDAVILAFVIAVDPGSDYSSENYRFFEARGTDHLYVDRIVVDESLRGQGIGRLLYDRVFRTARADGRAEVTCEVNVEPPNPLSLAFHARLGFVEVGRQGTKGDSVRVALLAASARTRTIAWSDPMVGARLATTTTGLDHILAMVAGQIAPPPIAMLMRMRPTAASHGTATFECDPDESHYNPIGTVHGGLVCTLLDSVIGCAVHTTLGIGQGYTSVDIAVSYLRPVRADTGTLTAVATVTKSGSRIAFAEARVVDEAGRLMATATSTCLVFPLEGDTA